MRNYYSPIHAYDLAFPETFYEIPDKRYKDTPFAIVKNKIGRDWDLYVLTDGGRAAYEICRYSRKSDAIKDIESGKIVKDFCDDFNVLKDIIKLITDHYDTNV